MQYTNAYIFYKIRKKNNIANNLVILLFKIYVFI